LPSTTARTTPRQGSSRRRSGRPSTSWSRVMPLGLRSGGRRGSRWPGADGMAVAPARRRTGRSRRAGPPADAVGQVAGGRGHRAHAAAAEPSSRCAAHLRARVSISHAGHRELGLDRRDRTGQHDPVPVLGVPPAHAPALVACTSGSEGSIRPSPCIATCGPGLARDPRGIDRDDVS